MKRHIRIISILTLTSALISCQDGTGAGSDVKGSEIRMFAEHAQDMWHEAEVISVFDGYSNLCYRALSEGSVSEFVSEETLGDNVEEIYALYPYDPEAFLGESGLRLVFPDIQNATSSGMDESALRAVAYVGRPDRNTTLRFEDMCSYFRFDVSAQDQIVEITISSGEGGALAGEIEVIFSGNDPVINVIDALSSITLKSDDVLSGTYVMPLLPVELEDGLYVTLKDRDGQIANRRVVSRKSNGTITTAVSFKRGKVNIDEIVFDNLFLPPELDGGSAEGYEIFEGFTDIWI